MLIKDCGSLLSSFLRPRRVHRKRTCLPNFHLSTPMFSLRRKLSKAILLGLFLGAKIVSADSTVAPAAYFEQSQITVAQSSGEVRIPVQVSGPPLKDFFGTRVEFSAVDGTARRTRDFDTPGSLIFYAGQNSQILIIGVNTGPAFLGTRTFTVSLRNSANYVIGSPSTITVGIIGSIVPAPEIEIEQPAGTGIANNGSKNFGSVAVGSAASLNFIIKNVGSLDLTGLTLSDSGSLSGDFTITSSPVSPVAGPGGTTSFRGSFAPSVAGTQTAAIQIANNDSDENPYRINLMGTGGDSAAITTHPASVNILNGESTTLTVTASGTAPLTYQWFRGLSGVTTFPVGTNSSSFTTPPLATTTAYWVKVTNPFNLVGANSNTATVAINRYRLTASGVNGTVTGAGTYDGQSIAVVTATPNPGYIFQRWSGWATGIINPTSVVMNADKSVTALFAPDLTDLDLDGLTLFEEVTIYGTNPSLEDTDSDGLNDGWEAGLGRFSAVSGVYTWAQARAEARSQGGDLACFPVPARWKRALETLGASLDNFTGLWIGATDSQTEGAWTWINGEAFAFQQWATSRPSAVAGNTLDYAEVAGGAGAEIGKWYDRTASVTRDGYILETGYATSPTDADSDDDGLSDGQERTLGTNSLFRDTDGDGLSDAFEVKFLLNPLNQDSDGDGISDREEDEDGDTLTNTEEAALGTSPRAEDSDKDGLKDQEEVRVHLTDPNKSDTDGDFLSDGDEIKLTGTNPLVKDTDGEGIQDGDEDLDRDGFTNRQELELFLTAPNNGSDHFAIQFAYTPSAHSLTFATISGRRYRVERSLELTDSAGWSEAVTFTGSGGSVTVPLGEPLSSTWFYRVRVSLN